MTHDSWFATVRDLTERLVNVRSVSPSADEIQVAHRVVELLGEGGLAATYALLDLAPIAHDPYHRANAVAYLPGRRKETIVLLGHIDTVGTQDYGSLEPLALDPSALAAHVSELMGGEELEHPEEWMFGRGALDMKSGVAANIAIMRHYARRLHETGEPPPLSMICVATPDEETQSAGALATSGWLARFREEHSLRYVGLINTDYVTARYPGDPEIPIFTGTVGKLLPLFYIVGKATHVGDPFDGVDANLISAELVRDLCMNLDLRDRVRDDCTPPPVTLHQADLKTVYNVQTAFSAWFYLNILTLATPPDEWLRRLHAQAEQSLGTVLARLAKGFLQTHAGCSTLPTHLTSSRVLTFAELRAAVVATRGESATNSLIDDARDRCPVTMDSREATLRVVEALWHASGLHGPAVVIALAPPFYPHIAGGDGTLERAARAVVARHADVPLVVREYFLYLSDISYMRLDPEMTIDALVTNMPLWDANGPQSQRAGYALPFADIAAAGVEGVVNIGPYGFGAHQRGERVAMPFSFGTVPQMIAETIEEVARTLPSKRAKPEKAASLDHVSVPREKRTLSTRKMH